MKVIRRLLGVVAIAAAAAILTWAFLSRNKPSLQVWHREAPAREWRWTEMGPELTLADYIARENEVFQEVNERVEARLDEVNERSPTVIFPAVR